MILSIEYDFDEIIKCYYDNLLPQINQDDEIILPETQKEQEPTQQTPQQQTQYIIPYLIKDNNEINLDLFKDILKDIAEYEQNLYNYHVYQQRMNSLNTKNLYDFKKYKSEIITNLNNIINLNKEEQNKQLDKKEEQNDQSQPKQKSQDDKKQYNDIIKSLKEQITIMTSENINLIDFLRN